MSMFVTVRARDGQVRDFDLHTGEPTGHEFRRDIEVLEVQADGDELDYILNCFDWLPLARHRVTENNVTITRLNNVQRWFGDHAKFIYHNLKW